MLSRPADARVRARFRVGAKRGIFRGKNGGGAGVFCTMAFGGKGGKAGGKTRKIRPSGGDLCSFRHGAGRSVQDCGKVVQKLAGREDENYKLCTTLCAPLRHGTRIVQVSFPRCVRCVGVVVRRCAIRSFSLPPAEAGCPFRRAGAGRRQAVAGENARAGAGCCARGRPPLPSPSPTLRSALRPSAGRGAVLGGLKRGGRTALRPSAGKVHGRRQAGAGRTHGRSGDCLVHFRLCARRYAISWQGRGRRQGKCGLLRKGASAFAFALPHPAHGGAGHVATTARPLSHSGADTPGSGRRANDILYIRVRRREGENVLHRAASNDVDNFSVDNPLWITAAARCRSLRGGKWKAMRGKCERGRGSANADGGSVNAGAEVQTQTGRVRKSSRAMGARRGVFRPHGRDFTAWTGRTYI